MDEKYRYAYKVFPLVFTAAQSDYEIEWTGARLFVQSSDVDFWVRLNGRSQDLIPMTDKSDIPAPFSSLFITTSGAANITLFLSNPADIRLGGLKVSVDTISSVEKAPNMTVGQKTLTGAQQVILAANTTRKAVVIKNIGAVSIYLDVDNGVAVTDYVIPAGEGEVFDRYTGAIHGITAGGNCLITYREVYS